MPDEIAPIPDPFGPIEASELINGGMLSGKFLVSSVIANTLDFKNKKRSLIIGRKGAGKTTLLHIMKKKNKINYILDIGEDFPTVAEQLSKEHRSEYTEFAAKIWSTVIWNSIIIMVCRELGTDLPGLTEKDRRTLRDYVKNLESKLQQTTESSAAKHSRQFAEKVTNAPWLATASVIRVVFAGELVVDDAREIIEKALLSTGNIVSILIDTMEFYKVKTSKAANDCLRGLLNCCTKIHSSSSAVECRLFFPDELTHFAKTSVSSSVLKDFRGAEYLRWNSPELVCMAVTRFRDRMEWGHFPGLKLQEFNRKSSADAQAILHGFLPYTVSNNRGLDSETVAYILRHTQYTPRQFLRILNECLANHFELSDGAPRALRGKLTGPEVASAVQVASKEICRDILATFREIYPDIRKILSRILPRLGRVFEEEELLEVCEARSVMDHFGIDFEDIKSALSDIGAVGIIDEARSNQSTACGRFSYMTDEHIELTASDRFCVHPIFSSLYAPRKHDMMTIQPDGASAIGS